MFDFRGLGRHYDAGAALGLVAPIVLAENAKRLSNCFKQALRGDLDGMLDALRVSTRDPASSNGHRTENISFVFYSLRNGGR